MDAAVTRAVRFAAALATLHAAHDLADHVLGQTDRQAARKVTDWRALAGHVGLYHVVLAASLGAADAALGLHLRPGRVAVALGWSAATHALLDRRWPVRWVLEQTGSRRFADGTFPVSQLVLHARGAGYAVTQPVPLHGPYLADQALHHAALWVAALVLAGGGPR